jgi:hypothetical protein
VVVGALALGACSGSNDDTTSTDSAPPTSATSVPDATSVPRGDGLGVVVLRAEDATPDWAEAEIDADRLREAEQESPSCFIDLTDTAEVSEFAAFELAPKATFNQKVVSFVFTTADETTADDFAQRVESGALADCLATGFNTPPPTTPGQPAPDRGRGIDAVTTTASPELGEGAFTIVASGELPVSLDPAPVPFEQTTVILRNGNTFAVAQFNGAVDPFPEGLRANLVGELQARLATR